MKLRLRAAAVRDLDGIFDYSLATHGAAAAEAYLRALKAAMERLLNFPELGAARDDLAPGLRGLPVREHRVFYRIEGAEVVVARVLHKAMDAERHL
jgi:toxin ParE1/3/4